MAASLILSNFSPSSRVTVNGSAKVVVLGSAIILTPFRNTYTLNCS